MEKNIKILESVGLLKILFTVKLKAIHYIVAQERMRQPRNLNGTLFLQLLILQTKIHTIRDPHESYIPLITQLNCCVKTSILY